MKKIVFYFIAFLAISQSLLAQTNIKKDLTFGKNGSFTDQLENVDQIFTNLHRYKGSNDMIAAGYYYDDNDSSLGLQFAKILANGQKDTLFGENGYLKINENDFPYYNIIRIREAADKSFLVLISDYADIFDCEETAIICFTAKGKIVTDFGDGGILKSSDGVFTDFDILPDGKILVNNLVEDDVNETLSARFERYSQLGVLDTTFGTNGVKEYSNGSIIYTTIENLNQGYVCAGLNFDVASLQLNPCISKVSAEGVLDATFGNAGVANASPVNSNNFILPVPSKIKILADESYILYGNSYDLDDTINDFTHLFMTKIDKTGNPITNFGQDSYVFLENYFDTDGFFNIEVQELSNKKLFVNNSTFNQNEDVESELRLFSALGKPETQFGTNGLVNFDVKDELTGTLCSALTTDGKILLGGGYFNSSTEYTDVFVSRITLENGVNTAEKITLADKISLFPNPVVEKTNLQYELAVDAIVSADLYDVLGKNVQQVMSPQSRNAGKQIESLTINSNLPTGQYLLKLKIGEQEFKTISVNKQ